MGRRGRITSKKEREIYLVLFERQIYREKRRDMERDLSSAALLPRTSPKARDGSGRSQEFRASHLDGRDPRTFSHLPLFPDHFSMELDPEGDSQELERVLLWDANVLCSSTLYRRRSPFHCMSLQGSYYSV